MAFTEFYCDTTNGANINGGSNAGAAKYTCTNSNWDGTSVFTPTDGSTPASSIAVGDFASVYNDGVTLAVYIARVTVVAAGVNGAITLSTTAFSGTAPTSSSTGRSITVGGAWKGPNAAQGFPFGFITNALTDSSNDIPRVNFKNNTTYSISAAMTHSLAGPIRFQGYTTTVGDQGKAVIDGGSTGTSYIALTASGADLSFADFEWKNNGNSGNSVWGTCSGARIFLNRIICHNTRSAGFNITGSGPNLLIECEAYLCNQSNSVNIGGFLIPAVGCTLIRCISHDNTGSNSCGLRVSSTSNILILINCIFDSNGASGLLTGNSSLTCTMRLINCDFYNNTTSGIVLAPTSTGTSDVFIENCNFIKNGAYGFNGGTGTTLKNGFLINCGFGAGTQANSSGQTNSLGLIQVLNSVTYANDVTPWKDPANGDFRINLAAARNAGEGSFIETSSSLTAPNTVGYPDIGAAQHRDTEKSFTFAL